MSLQSKLYLRNSSLTGTGGLTVRFLREPFKNSIIGLQKESECCVCISNCSSNLIVTSSCTRATFLDRASATRLDLPGTYLK